MKKILISPDIPGWVCDSMAKGIIKSLSHKFEFTLKYSDGLAKEYNHEVINWYEDIEKYDIIYIMLPSYIPKGLDDYSKIITSYHGGPGTEGQVEMLMRLGLMRTRMSYVSNQTKERVTGKHKLQLYYTPHGVDDSFFDQKKITGDFVCGYAGWIRYLSDAQKKHRRGFWIVDAWRKDNFLLSIAAGIEINKAIHEDIEKMKNRFSSNMKLKINIYPYEKMPDFYKGISLYLVPDKFAGGPVPVLEAGAMGIPVVCSNAGLCGEIIKNNHNGLLIKDQDEFEKSIVYMKHNPKERIRMGNNLRDYIREYRTWNAVSLYWEKFFLGER